MTEVIEHQPFLKPEWVEARAKEVLTRYNLTTVPIDPVILAERAGIQVNNAEFSDATTAGMIVKRGDDVLVLVSQKDSPYRKRFTIAHELGHHFLHLEHGDGEYMDKEVEFFRRPAGEAREMSPERQREIQANMFAASLLMPEDDVRRYWKERKSIEDLARIFKVSAESMGYRLDALGLD